MLFDEEYQVLLLSRMCVPEFMRECGHLLEPSSFDSFFDLAEEVISRWRNTRKVLNRTQLKQLAFRHGVKLGSPSGDIEFDRQSVLKFAQHQALKRGFERAHVLHASGRYQQALNVMEECKAGLPQLNGRAPRNILESTSTIPKRKNLVGTGMKKLDELLEGGVAAGDLAVVIAPTSGGKTSLLTWFACQGVLSGKKVYYTTLEVPEYEIEAKVRRNLTGDKNPSRKKWKEVAAEINGMLWVKEHAPHTIGPSGLDNEIPQEAELIIIDYADYLQPPGGGTNAGMEYHDLGHIYSNLKRIAMTRGIPVWTASQVNRSAYDVEQLRAENVEASLKKMMIADQVLGFQQEDTDPKSGLTTCNVYVSKNRHGSRFVGCKVTADFSICRFMEGERF